MRAGDAADRQLDRRVASVDLRSRRGDDAAVERHTGAVGHVDDDVDVDPNTPAGGATK